jgi:predicted nucleic acid-binding protein
MIILDTNVISETMKPQPHPSVLAWLDAQAAKTLFLSSITIAELSFGIAALPAGRRQDRLVLAFEGIQKLFQSRILSFDLGSARHYGALAVKARTNGLGFPTPDGYLAAIAFLHGFAIASRDTGPFTAAGLKVINPWDVL